MTELPKRRLKQAVKVNGNADEKTINEYEAAEYLGISVHWIRQSRTKNPKWAGPVFVKRDGYHVAYRTSDLDKFLAHKAKSSRVVDPADRFVAA